MVRTLDPEEELRGIEDTTAKHALDKIGEKIYEKAKKNAEQYRSQLHGRLSDARFEKAPKEQQTPSGPCGLNHEYHTNATNGKSYPCRTGKEERFSQVHGGECDKNKISGNKDDEGACAPYRRLNLCVRNLENISNYGKINNDTLLADVCLAALHEGAAISSDHGKYQETNNDVNANICTMLARSFADIGDIIRGKDLYRGVNGNDKLEKNLKKIFGIIYEGLTKANGKKGQKPAKDHYGDDENYYKLREDWWNNNRLMVWYAITCGAPKEAQYFRKTCGSGERTKDNCRCAIHGVPTYFDYVPQYLRWFEEWAEEFCRLRKHKLQNAIKNCRGENNEKYCDLNGYDCEKTIRGKKKLFEGADCKKCTVTCDNFVPWIKNQKQEFDKQKNKYAEEIKKAKADEETSSRNINNIYEKDFYERLKTHYGSVNEFLKKLNEERICKDEPKVKEEKADAVDFTKDETNGTFYRTTYCEACPWCGAEKVNGQNGKGGKWEPKNEACSQEEERIFDEQNITEIPVLTPEEGQSGILKKYSKFCKNGATGEKSKNGNQIETWKCYYDENENKKDGNGAINFCVLQNDKIGKKEEKSMHYHPFFWKWVTEMLIDSMYWRKELKSCINNKRGKCKNKKCNNDCKCYESWVQQKENEWKLILQHFKKQGGFSIFGNDYNYALKALLDVKEILTNIKDTYGNVKELEGINNMLEKENENNEQEASGGNNSQKKNTIDLMIDHEQKEAQNCKENNPDKCENTPGVRSQTPPANQDDVHDDVHDDLHDNEITRRDLNIKVDPQEVHHEEEVVEEEPEATKAVKEDTDGEGGSPKEDEEAAKRPSQEDPKVCETVDKALTETNLKDACPTKYGKNAPVSWKCIPTSGSGVTATGGGSGEPKGRHRREANPAKASDSNQGAICVPPRRRRLYIQKLHDWATAVSPQASGDKATQAAEPQASDKAAQVTEASASSSSSESNSVQTTPASTSSPSNSRDVDLVKAFVESAAVETFFLWDRYKKENTKRQGGGAGGLGGVPGVELPELPVSNSVEKTPQTQLASGDIPTPFLRQMFYTLGDYRDILVRGGNTSDSGNTNGSNNNNIVLLASENKQEMENIQEQLKVFFSNSGNQSSTVGRNPSQSRVTPASLWGDFAQYIWNGMICALTYEEKTSGSDDKGVKIEQNEGLKEALLEDKTNEPKKPQYQYKTVELKEENSDTQPITPGSSSPSGGDPINNPKLTQFVERPPYFRYLHEWGQNFCKKRKGMLENIKKECMKDSNSGSTGKKVQKCSCYGEHCDDQLKDDPSIFPSLNCPSCGRHCSFYKKWIKKKRTEFEKQSNAYEQQKTKYQRETKGAENTDHDNGFYTRLQNLPDAAAFLQKLGSCSKKVSEKDNEKIFEDTEQTFKDADNCKPCSQFKINCKSGDGHCDNNKGNHCQSKSSIEAKHIKKEGGLAEDIDMLVSDNGTTGFYDLSICISSGIFKGIRKDIWECGNVCGYNVCKPKNVNGETFEGQANGKNQIIFIRALFKIWLEYFLKDYNKINAKISYCKENGGTNICIKNCADKWIKLKKEEWGKIKEHYLEKKHEDGDNDMTSLVTNFLRDVQPQTDVNKAIEPCKGLENFEKSCGLHGDANEQNKNGYQDAIDCLLDKLRKEATSCPGKTSDKTQAKCQESTPPDDDESLEEEENTVGKQQPSFCPKPPEPKPEDEGGCETAQTTPKEPTADGGEGTENQPPVIKPEKEDTKSKDIQPQPPTAPPEEKNNLPQPSHPLPSDNTSDILKTTIPFGIALALTSIVFLYLKKKTKSTIDLLRVINIPKSDYDIPTKRSPNRYIPYTSGKYRGKRYIYLEGDSGTDSGYTDHYSDITSSSESEYEELDINDIYVPGSPKYKTLIEVVLEPSGNNTTASDTPSDTQNDIQNDGIPSSKITDNEWNTLKDEFISQYLQSEQPKDVPNDYSSGDIPFNTQPNTLYFDKPDEKPFITSIHDRNLYSGEEYSYNVHMVNTMDDIPKYVSNNVYSGIDLINDTLSGNKNIDIYDEVLKRKENELFGTNHVKQTSIHSVAKLTNSDPIHNQLELFHKWLDRHRDMCEKWENHHERLAKLKEEWENETHSGNIHPSDSNKTLNTDVSIQIHMDNPKPINQFTNMDTILEDLDKYNEPYYDVQDDIYYDVNDHDASTVDSNTMDIPSKVQIEMDVNTKLVKEKYPIADVWDI
ncbi:erythrocyte membrane protein 1 [Plasmodium falciparum NF54]|uniref:Erythrocyte membrane protein 1, PfEMP1 n=6 Tax=Plasmodium falciparum TaxID=5833 RepID=Q8IIZ6_PLAF7|nr:erythrocyte membrane protein 1, PfEMP1 [Plasmodium falciparum 3D7]KAF4330834.1 erythrocyte membrane protein 1 [Plasmodium falciparum NF54]PKC43675.1 erythrocyte membrane protein 1 [Plasmodium falciparum NF54]CZT98668.1 erythrocyte membrane protein 1, PfEMP1 [Plasmodium falciparum 3D7]|eukprot:XP_001347690.2 erythrocyte membrane protein 1, PfEMP1 [Plasmodium falciparum 3D7]